MKLLGKLLKKIGLVLLIGALLNTSVFTPSIAQTGYLDRFNGAILAAIGKAPVDAATTVNITLSGYQTIDTIALNTDGMRVLVKNQTDQTQNGIYTVYSGTWVRAADFSGPSGTVAGQLVYVTGGTQAALWQITTPNPIYIGTTGGWTTTPSNITFAATSIPVSNLALTSAYLYVGNVTNTAVGVPLTGDCTITNAGVITCTKTNGTSFATIAKTGAITDATGTLAVAHGGTGQTTLTSGSVLIGAGTSGVTSVAPATNTCLITSGGVWVAGSCTGAAGTGTVNSGTANQLAYYASSSNVVSGTNALPSGTTATTPSAADNSTKIATTGFVNGTALTLSAGTTATTQSALDNSTKVATTAYADAATASNVSGPVSSTTNDIAVFNGTTGKVIQDSGVLTSSLAPKASPTFTGVPAAPTAASGTSTTQLATTAFVNPASSIATNGYTVLPNGLYLQWGVVTHASSLGAAQTITFPIAFPNNAFSVTYTAENVGGGDLSYMQLTSLGTSNFITTSSCNRHWMAIGN